MRVPARGGVTGDDLAPGAGDGESAPAPAPVAAAAQLRQRIAAAGLVPGERLGEVALAAELQVSRNSLREAFTMLASEGLVERRPHRGVFVAAPGPEDVRGLYRTRRVIQLGALEHGELTPGAARHLRCAQDLLSGGPDTPARVLGDANHRVHVGIVDLAGAPELTRLMASVQARVRLAFHPMDEQTRLHVQFADRNRWIVERLLAGDLPAVHAMFGDYLDEAEQFVLAHLAAPGD